MGLSRVEGVGRDLLKSDTLGGRNLAQRAWVRLGKKSKLTRPREYTQRRTQKAQFIGNR